MLNNPFKSKHFFPIKYIISFKSKRILGGTIISLFAIYSRILNRGIFPNKRTGGNLFQIWLAALFLEFEIWKLKSITDLLSEHLDYFSFLFVSRTGTVG